MIKVIFQGKNGGYGLTEYTYKDYENAQIGDIVVVNTVFGYALAKVTQVDVIDEKYTNREEELKSIQVVVETETARVEKEKAETEKRNAYNKIVKNARKAKVLAEVKMLLTEEEYKTVSEMDYNDLMKFYNAI